MPQCNLHINEILNYYVLGFWEIIIKKNTLIGHMKPLKAQADAVKEWRTWCLKHAPFLAVAQPEM